MKVKVHYNSFASWKNDDKKAFRCNVSGGPLGVVVFWLLFLFFFKKNENNRKKQKINKCFDTLGYKNWIIITDPPIVNTNKANGRT